MPRRSLLTTSPPSSSSTASTTSTSTPNTDSSHPVPETFKDTQPLPRLLIFDLDYTLWPFWVDTHPSPPFRALPRTHPRHGLAAVDRSGEEYGFYDGVGDVIRACGLGRVGVHSGGSDVEGERGSEEERDGSGSEERDGSGSGSESDAEGKTTVKPPITKPKIAVASRTHTPSDALQLLSLLHIDNIPAQSYISSTQAYPGSKVTHLRRISAETGIPYEEMVFFDDESRNGEVEGKLGVCFVLVRDGVDVGVVDEGVRSWRRRWGRDGGEKGKSGKRLGKEGKKRGDGRMGANVEGKVVNSGGGHSEL